MAMVDLTRLTRSAALVLLAALFGPLAARAETAIHFTLDRKIDGPAAPFFLAIDRGYFKDEGLDLIIDIAAGGPLEALNRLAAGKADVIAFGRPILANPDVIERWQTHAALNPPDPATFYTPGPKGYTDYPTQAKQPQLASV